MLNTGTLVVWVINALHLSLVRGWKRCIESCTWWVKSCDTSFGAVKNSSTFASLLWLLKGETFLWSTFLIVLVFETGPKRSSKISWEVSVIFFCDSASDSNNFSSSWCLQFCIFVFLHFLRDVNNTTMVVCLFVCVLRCIKFIGYIMPNPFLYK